MGPRATPRMTVVFSTYRSIDVISEAHLATSELSLHLVFLVSPGRLFRAHVSLSGSGDVTGCRRCVYWFSEVPVIPVFDVAR